LLGITRLQGNNPLALQWVSTSPPSPVPPSACQRGCAQFDRHNVLKGTINIIQVQFRSCSGSMDPISALGAAAGAVQFLDFVAKILSSSAKVYRYTCDNGEAHRDLKAISVDLQNLNQKMLDSYSKKKSASQDLAEYDDIKALCKSCNQVAQDLDGALAKLEKEPGSKPWKNFHVALKSVWSEKDISALQQRVDNFRHQISLQLLTHIQ
jgi:hypothetical protein